MRDDIRRIVLVGGGLAAAKAAETLRTEGFDGTVTLVTDEPHLPYERPPLSKDVLLGTQDLDSLEALPSDFYEEHGIEAVTGDPAVAIDRDAGRVRTAASRTLPFDRLLLATGARARTLPLEKTDLPGVLTLRTLDDALYLADKLATVHHVTVVGAGWIGCEVAAAARAAGVDVTMVDPLDAPLQRVLGRDIGDVFTDLHTHNGVDLRLGVGVTGVTGRDDVETVELGDGETVPTQLVVVGIGVVPATGLAEAANLDVDDGILVDQTLTTSDPRILAAGDVANAWHPFYRHHLRIEHWANALNQGITAGRNLLGAAQTYDRIPYFFSDQYDLGMEYLGHGAADDDVVVRGSTHDREFIAFWLRDGHVVAGMNVNVWDVTDDIRSLIESRSRPDRARLADPDTPLDEVTP